VPGEMPPPHTCLAAENKLRPIAQPVGKWVSDWWAGPIRWAVELWGNQGKVPPLCLFSAFFSSFPPFFCHSSTQSPRHANVVFLFQCHVAAGNRWAAGKVFWGPKRVFMARDIPLEASLTRWHTARGISCKKFSAPS